MLQLYYLILINKLYSENIKITCNKKRIVNTKINKDK